MGSSASSNSSSGENYILSGENGKSLEIKINPRLIKNLSESIKSVKKLQVPLFDNDTAQFLSNLAYLTGNAPFHEGLIFESVKGNLYIAQTYPVTFKSVKSLEQAKSEIIKFCTFNRDSQKAKISNVYYPSRKQSFKDVIKIIKKMPNEYSILDENCQKFCDRIINGMNLIEISN